MANTAVLLCPPRSPPPRQLRTAWQVWAQPAPLRRAPGSGSISRPRALPPLRKRRFPLPLRARLSYLTEPCVQPGLACPTGQPVSSRDRQQRAGAPKPDCRGPPWSGGVFCTANVCVVSLQYSVSCYRRINEFITVLCNCKCLKIPSMYIYVSLHNSV